MFIVVWLNNLVNSFSRLSQGLHRERSMDSPTTASALRAMEPVHTVQTVTLTLNFISLRDSYLLDHRANNVAAFSNSTTSVQVSDLLREQFYLQSEISYGSHASTRHTSRSPSPVPEESQDREERLGTYRASISITPATPPRPNTEEKQQERDGSGVKTPAVGGSAAAGEQENLQQLIKQVKIYFLKKRRYIRSEW